MREHLRTSQHLTFQESPEHLTCSSGTSEIGEVRILDCRCAGRRAERASGAPDCHSQLRRVVPLRSALRNLWRCPPRSRARGLRVRGVARLGGEAAGVVIDESCARHYASNRHSATLRTNAFTRLIHNFTPQWSISLLLRLWCNLRKYSLNDVRPCFAGEA